jgi:hypothetical protein
MIRGSATVIMHRSPLKRIGDARTRPVEAPTVDLDCIAKFQEWERIWVLVRQSAEGCNAPTVTE